MSYTFHVPTKVLFGAGVLKKLHEEKLPGKKALVVISNGKSTRTNGSLAALEAELDAAGVAHVLFDKIQTVTPRLWRTAPRPRPTSASPAPTAPPRPSPR